MKSLKAFLTIFTFILAITIATAQSEKTLVKSFNLQGTQSIVLDLGGDVEIREWKNTILRVQMVINITNGNDSMLKSLMTAGRYNLYSQITDDTMKIFAPETKKEMKLGGQDLVEKISYIIYAPENVLVKMAGEASTDAKTTPPTESSSL